MIFAARHRSYSRLDSSPVASGWSRSCSMMKRSIVMTEVDVCTLPIGREGNSAHLVRSEDLTAPTPQPAEHLGCRMAVVIVRAHADHGLARPQLGGEVLDYGREPAQVISIAMRRHDQRDPPGTVATQERDHDPSPRVDPRDPRVSIDRDPAAVRRSQHRRVALAYIQEKYSQATAVVEDDVAERRPDDQRHEKGDACGDKPATARSIPQPPARRRDGQPDGRRPPAGDHDDVTARHRRRTLRDEIEQRET